MSDYEAFVHELIGYIFKVQDNDDDNLSAEIICRKLYKYGLIENVNHEWRMKYRPKHRWPATVHNGRADKEDWQSYTIDRKDENSSEKPNNSTISKMEQVEDEPQTNKDFKVTYTCSFTECDNFKNFGFGEKCIECKRKQSEAKHKDEPQTERSE